ncbi:hypothetical protein RF11_12343 [Thelohanellus kitauei]|uniref:Uncharacterized protein n=1 Tax=Thelohanellus kitauei TaxID=669202 RepID=A0A0C2NFT0_THEKT|nr:hypothetical protein RF11_12343 [Thelohanellus kitauei]
MVKVLNPKQSKYQPKKGGVSKKSGKPGKYQGAAPKPSNLGKLPKFDPLKQKLFYDDKLVKSLIQDISSKKVKNQEKQPAIDKLVKYLTSHNFKFISKRWSTRALGLSLKYSGSNETARIISMVLDNFNKMEACPDINILIFKIFKYWFVGLDFSPVKQRNKIFDALKSRIFKLQFSSKKLTYANKIFQLLNNMKKHELMACFFIEKSEDCEQISYETFTSAWNREIATYDKYHTWYEYVKNYINISIKDQKTESFYFCYLVDSFFSVCPIQDAINLSKLFSADSIAYLCFCKEGIKIIARFLRICSTDDYELVLMKLCEFEHDVLSRDEFSYIHLTCLFQENQLEIYERTLLRCLLSNFSASLKFCAWCQLISFTIQPRNKKFISSIVLDFIDHCDSLSGSPNSGSIYRCCIDKILQPLVQYFIDHASESMSCKFKCNLLLQIFEYYYEIGHSFDIKNLYKKIAKQSNCIQDNVPLYSTKQVCWFIIKLIHDDSARDSLFIKYLIKLLQENTIKIFMNNKNTSFIINVLKNKCPNNLQNDLNHLLG